MAETDNPLKQLFRDFIVLLAAWLIGQPVKNARALNTELAASTLRSDQVFDVTLESDQNLLLHVEFESSAHKDKMKWRMLEYMSRLACEHQKHIFSVVIYLGRAGKGDLGNYNLSLNGQQSLSWSYKTLHLKELAASELLAMDNAALITMIGLSNLKSPEEELKQAIERLKAEDDNDRDKLMRLLISLLPTKELTKMVEKWTSTDEFFRNLPYQQYLEERYEEIHQEALVLGIQKGIQEGIETGRQEGIEQGLEKGLRQALLGVIHTRFTLDYVTYNDIAMKLEAIEDIRSLHQLIQNAAKATSIEEILASFKPFEAN